ncbi:hypothetical protein [Rhodocyclus gracilis]|uniref:Uncharacterized protein n=1 Tax=Rhodocyclus tenuis TaxID=1066 RepID=A0A6L5JTV9_RHOTE|nr:hypothetical protein [Rhodocyclus gracilis]MQY50833.1 hypothetical protein [Rhodocyclus gracilis]
MTTRQQLYAIGEPFGDSATAAKIGGGYRCGGGGGSSSSSANTTTTNTTDKRLVVDTGVGVSSDSSTVNVSVLDQGAINGAIDLAKTGTVSAYSGIDKLLGFAKDVLELDKQSQKLVAQSAENVGSAYKTAQDASSGQRFMVAGGMIIAGIVAVSALKKG